jgi:predicted PurR-regulated permease PerM
VNTWATVFLGIIAAATLMTAVLQVVLLVAGVSLVRRISRFVDFIETEVKPIVGHIDAIARDASRAASLALAQVERADQLLSNTIERIEQTLTTVQSLIINALREGNALMMGVRAVMAAVRGFQRRQTTRRRAEDDEALFI